MMRSANRITPNGGKLMVTLGEGAMLLILNRNLEGIVAGFSVAWWYFGVFYGVLRCFAVLYRILRCVVV